MLDALKQLVDSSVLSESAKEQIQEAWDTKLNEVRIEVETSLREEFAQRYEHDKNQLVEAMDTMVTESLQKEISELVEDKQALIAEKVAYKNRMKQNTGLVQEFVSRQLAKEVSELHDERKQLREGLAVLEKFVMKQLGKEVSEFAQDKQAVVEARVKLAANAKVQLEDLKQKFIKRSAKVVESVVGKQLTSEITQLKQDLEEARRNDFGKRLFEAFANEYKTSFFKSSNEVTALQAVIEEKEKALEEAKQQAQEKAQLVESKEKEISMIKESTDRERTMGELLKPLNKAQAAIMEDLLRTVKSEKLKESYDKYLPSVLNNDRVISKGTPKTVISESTVEVTGNKQPKEQPAPAAEIIDIRKLAGLN